jgi:hypothetical protein
MTPLEPRAGPRVYASPLGLAARSPPLGVSWSEIVRLHSLLYAGVGPR